MHIGISHLVPLLCKDGSQGAFKQNRTSSSGSANSSPRILKSKTLQAEQCDLSHSLTSDSIQLDTPYSRPRYNPYITPFRSFDHGSYVKCPETCGSWSRYVVARRSTRVAQSNLDCGWEGGFWALRYLLVCSRKYENTIPVESLYNIFHYSLLRSSKVKCKVGGL